MCVVSMVGDFYQDKWRNLPSNQGIYLPVSRAEFETLKKEVEDMKALLKKAKLYDEQTGQPECEMDSKMQLLRKIAELVGISLDDVLKPKQ